MNFISRNGSLLYENEVLLRFISFNIPNLFIIEDPYWHQSTVFEQTDALFSISELGGRVARVYPFSFQKSDLDYPRHFYFSDKKWIMNEQLFKDVDRALVLANASKTRLIIPFIDVWDYWGGIPSFTMRNGRISSEFFTNPQLRDQFKKVIYDILHRVNAINGIMYKEDPTIMAWETGNELEYLGTRVPADWTIDISKYIKDMDSKHLLIDGSNGALGWDHSILMDANIDIYSNHYYIRMEPKQLVTLILFPILWIILIIWIIKSIFRYLSKSPNTKHKTSNMYLNAFLIVFVPIGFILADRLSPIVFPDISALFVGDDQLISSYNKVLLVGLERM